MKTKQGEETLFHFGSSIKTKRIVRDFSTMKNTFGNLLGALYLGHGRRSFMSSCRCNAF